MVKRVLVLLLSWGTIIAQPCDPFPDLSKKSKDEIFNNYKNSAVRIERDEVGTGFFIDLDSGYLITASHVVKVKDPDNPSKIMVTSEAFSGSIEFELVRDLQKSPNKKRDIALLKPKDKDDLGKISQFSTQIDLSHQFPKKGENLYSIGYPAESIEPVIKELQYQKRARQFGVKVFEALGGLAGGDSGGPVINEYGFAIGIVVSIESMLRGFFLPIHEIEPLLEDMKPTKNLILLEKDLLEKNISEEDLVRYLSFNNNPNSNISNLQLMIWANRIEKNKSIFSPKRRFFRCPIFDAYLYRRIDESGKKFWDLLAPIESARLFQGLGNKYANADFTEEANGYYEKSQQNYVKGINQLLDDNPGYYAYLESELIQSNGEKVQSITGIKSIDRTGNQGSELDENFQNYLSAIFKDLSLVCLDQARLSEKEERDHKLDKSLIYSFFAQTIAASNNFKAGAYALIGDILFEKGEFEYAKDAYAYSYQLGAEQNWVVDNFQYSEVRKTGIKIENPVEEIKAYDPKLDSKEILTIGIPPGD